MGKKILISLSLIVLALIVAGGSFYGGMLFQQSQAAGVRDRFFADRGGAPNTGGGFADGNAAGGNFAGGGLATSGEIKSIDGNTVTLSTPQSEVRVTLTDATAIQKTVSAETGDLQVGQRILVRGERDSSGNVTASDIQITDSGQAQ